MSVEVQPIRRPAVTIGMPVYNAESFIHDALASLLAQTFADFELVISDNASTDQTEAICREYARRDNRIRYIRQTANQGASANFGFVLDQATSEYFMWAAHDDTRSENWIEIMLQNFTVQDAGLFGSYCVVGSTRLQKPPLFLQRDFGRFFLRSYQSGKDYYIYSLFRTQLLRKANFALMQFRVGGDELLLLNLLNYGHLRSVDAALFYSRLRPDNETFRLLRLHTSPGRRLFISGFPAGYYRLALRAVPDSYRKIMWLMIPIKYILEQLRLWSRVPSALTQRFTRA